MKRLRIVFGIFCLIATITVIAIVCHQWYIQGCGWYSLIAAIIFYSVCALGIWWTTDEFLASIQKEDDDNIYLED